MRRWRLTGAARREAGGGDSLQGRRLVPAPKVRRHKHHGPRQRRFSWPGARVARVVAVSHPGRFTSSVATEKQGT
ncbi:hypothetical protein [Citrobacter sp. BDA59-3]|uniref:hypothetical protein n=1 Tax=Citrobacter sp. BDA59-3 TaxID=2781952 RepID=UPI00187E4B54|nr:hypothetical protein [Citrobacter sp. BDA59-3]QOV69124.1 hypothetical protein IP582_01525 [Citrobacter sp. BDA59-3]